MSDTQYLGLVSDSHGRFGALEKMADAEPHVGAWIHAGDYSRDGDDLALYTDVPVFSVLGNNDLWGDSNAPERRVVTWQGVRIAVIHGHQWYGERRMKKLLELGRTADASLVVFGHSHRRFLEEEQGITLVNPGSIALPRDNKRGTYAVCEITNGTVGNIIFKEI